MLEPQVPRAGYRLWTPVREWTGPLVVWAVWGAMTAAAILLIQQNARNVPYMDDFALVSVMTGQQPVSFAWLWSQSNEHRPVIPRLILAGLFRFIDKDFRAGMYVNAGFMAAAAAAMILLARRIRGHTSVMDAILPLSILNIGQAETLLIDSALNLVLSAWISFELIAGAGAGLTGWRLALKVGLFLVLLPLCGGSGLVMLPPLMLWLFTYVAWGSWSGHEPGGAARAIGLLLLMGTSAVVALCLNGYAGPDSIPPAPSLEASALTALRFLSLLFYIPGYWWPAGLGIVFLAAATLLRLAVVGLRTPEERPRVMGLSAVILAVLCVAAAVGVSRSGLGPASGLASRYITIAAPLLAAIYVAWLVCGPAPARWAIHIGLLALVCLAIPANREVGRLIGTERGAALRDVERGLAARMPASQLMGRVCPALLPDASSACDCFNMLKSARIGKFKYFIDDRLAADPAASSRIRR
jgi:hypothetical protein